MRHPLDAAARTAEGGMMMFDFEISEDNGRITYICAKNRSDAIRLFIEEKGCSKDFVKRHYLVKCLGKVK